MERNEVVASGGSLHGSEALDPKMSVPDFRGVCFQSGSVD